MDLKLRFRFLKTGGAVLALLSTYGLLVTISSSSASSSAVGSCGPRHTRTLAASHRVRVYTVKSAGPQQTVYGCLRPSGRPIRIGPVPRTREIWSDSLRSPFLVSGLWAGSVEDRQIGQDGFRSYTAARNLGSGRGSRCFIGGGNRPGALQVLNVLIGPAGNMVWIDSRAAVRERTRELGVCKAGRKRILDQDPGLDPSSLVIHSSTVFWSDSSGKRSERIG